MDNWFYELSERLSKRFGVRFGYMNGSYFLTRIFKFRNEGSVKVPTVIMICFSSLPKYFETLYVHLLYRCGI